MVYNKLINDKTNKTQNIIIEIIAWIGAILFFGILGYAFYHLFIV